MLFETIRIENGAPLAVEFHERRLNRSREMLGLGGTPISLATAISVPEAYRVGIVRCRIDAAERIERVIFSHYHLPVVERLKVVEAPIEYGHKAADRSEIEQLVQKYPGYDDLLISRGGWLSDATIANIALEQDGRWYTPDSPLLAGTVRERLLRDNVLEARPIHRSQLGDYRRIALINALRLFVPESALPTSAVEN